MGRRNRDRHHWNFCHWSLCHRSRRSSCTRPTGAVGLGIRLHLRLPTGLAGSHLGPSGQGGSHQVQTLMEVALSSYYPMIIVPFLDPPCEACKAIQMQAGGLVEEVLDVGHKVHWTGLLEGQGFLLELDEVVKEPLLDPGPFRLRKVVDAVFIVDLEDMLQVLPPSTATKVCCQPCGITEGRPWLTSPPRLGSFRCWWWWWGTRCRPGGQITLLMRWLRTRHPWYTSWATDGSAAVSPPSHCRPSAVLCCATHGGGFICGGVSNDPSPRASLAVALLVGRV